MNESIGEALLIIAEKTGHGIEYVYPLLVKAQVMLGVRDAVVPLIAIAIGIYCSKKTYNSLKDNNSWHKDGSDVGMALFIGLAALLVSGFLIHEIFDGIIRATNPEYWALKEILGTVKG